MTFFNIAATRLINQQIENPQYSAPEELLSRIGAMQAQDYEMAKWALGVRLPGSTRKTIEKAIEEGHIIRTHVLRPTWHFVAAKDLRWILELTAPRIRVSIRSRQKQLGLTEEVVSKSNRVIEKALRRNQHMPRSGLVAELENAGFENEDNRAGHLLLCAELDGVICSGPSKGKDYTYALFEKRIPSSKKLTKEEALGKLAEIYFKSHGPAALEDFIWWSGLTKTQAKKALEIIQPNLTSEEIDSQTYWFSDSILPSHYDTESVHLLPAFDEYLISYKDRSAAITLEAQKKAISNNGIFRPIIVVNGEVVGIWKRTEKRDTVHVETKFFNQPSVTTLSQCEEVAEKFADFLGRGLKINHIID